MRSTSFGCMPEYPSDVPFISSHHRFAPPTSLGSCERLKPSGGWMHSFSRILPATRVKRPSEADGPAPGPRECRRGGKGMRAMAGRVTAARLSAECDGNVCNMQDATMVAQASNECEMASDRCDRWN